jgi:D-threo-aldose 1-dehydrogenase
MRTRPLGGTGVQVTELAFGAAGIGNLYRPIRGDDAAAAVDAAWDAGIRTFDTAPHYGLGLSERRLGAALRDRPREAYTVSTKVGRLLVPDDTSEGDDLANGFAAPATHRRVWDFSADGVRRSLGASLERLGLDRVDIVLLHDPDDHAEQALREGYPALERLRGEGVVGAIGIGMNQCALPARFLRETDIDVVLLAGRYTLLEQEGLDELLPEAAARGHVRLRARTGARTRTGPAAEVGRRAPRRAAACRRPALPPRPPGGREPPDGRAVRRGGTRHRRAAAAPRPGSPVGRPARGRTAGP